jgi:A nuclease family of the HNH/ENDO VII superfamily with conserved AHH
MEIGELVAVAAVAQDSKEDCWFCTEEPVTKKKNDLKADPDTSAAETATSVPENKEDNDSSTLGSNLIAAKQKEPQWRIKNLLKPGKMSTVVPAAHHCIPGEASMAKATPLHGFMREGGDADYESDIGYDINAAENGVWLPGNYAVREGNPDFDSKTWTLQTAKFQKDYVKLAMNRAGGKLFHDAHRTYNGKVKTTLLSIANKLTKRKKGKCPICKQDEKKNRPPYGLVGRLHGVSNAHRTMVVSPSKKTVAAGYYTSSKGRDVVLAKPGK